MYKTILIGALLVGSTGFAAENELTPEDQPITIGRPGMSCIAQRYGYRSRQFEASAFGPNLYRNQQIAAGRALQECYASPFSYPGGYPRPGFPRGGYGPSDDNPPPYESLNVPDDDQSDAVVDPDTATPDDSNTERYPFPNRGCHIVSCHQIYY